jgi:hypothetical protein
VSVIELLEGSSIESLISWELDFWMISVTDNKNIGESGGEGFAL